jgi:acetyl esterase
MTLDGPTAKLLAQTMASASKPVHEMTVEEVRDLARRTADLVGAGPAMAKIVPGHLAVTGGFLPYRVLYPNQTPAALIVFYPGGGWVAGGLAENETLARTLAQRTGAAVMIADYRRAPEYRFPTAVCDAYAMLLQAARTAADSPEGPLPLVVAGFSAGGNLAAVITQWAKRDARPCLAAQVLVCPITDSDLNTTAYLAPENQLLLSRDTMRWYWDQYAPTPQARAHYDASPMRYPDLRGLPPTIVITAEHDVLRDDGELYATLLLQAGVPVRSHRIEGQMHGFFNMVNVLPGCDLAIDLIGQGLAEFLGTPWTNTPQI